MEYQIQDFRPPASTADITEVERARKHHFPGPLKRVLLASNGVNYWRAPKEIQFLGTKEQLEYYSAYQFPEYLPDGIPFAMDGNGNFILFRYGHGESVFIVSSGNLNWEDSAMIAETFELFLSDEAVPESYLGL